MTELDAHEVGQCLGYGECDRCDRERAAREKKKKKAAA